MNITKIHSLHLLNVYIFLLLIYFLILLFKFIFIVKLGPAFGLNYFFSLKQIFSLLFKIESNSFLIAGAMKAVAVDVRTWRDFFLGLKHDPG